MSDRILYTPRKKKRVRRPLGKTLVFAGAVLFLSLLLLGGIFLVRLPKWQVAKIEIEGTEFLDGEEMKQKILQNLEGQLALVVPRSSFFLVRETGLAALLKSEFPKIKTVSVEKKFPDGLQISVEERNTWGIVCNDLELNENTSCAYIDASGFTVDSAPNSTGSLILKIRTDVPEIVPGMQALEQGFAEKLVVFGAELKKAIGSGATLYEISAKVPKEVAVRTSEGFKLILLRDDNFENVLKVLKRVLEEEVKENRTKLSYIDLRFGNKVFFKYR